MKESPSVKDHRSRIPNINRLIRMVQDQMEALPHNAAARIARSIASHLRNDEKAKLSETLIAQFINPLTHPGPRLVINGSGILLHTNLGRAPLNRKAVQAALDQVAEFTDLEMDLDNGKRGHRDRHFRAIAQAIWGVEDATLVNNAAAAVCLSLTALAAGKETIVSRGELIEIGGSFRLPDIMNVAGTKLVEVGATNKTKPSDFENAITPNTACMMKTHTSNYRIEGFTHEVVLPELVRIGRDHGVEVVMDLGSGLSRELPFPTTEEPFIEDYIEMDPDLLIFSGDKMFGGVQAGIVVGKHASVNKLRKHPMMRMLRQDKLSISLICHQLRDIALHRQQPFSQLACVHREDLLKRAKAIKAACQNLEIEIRDDHGFTGGGSLPQEQRPSVALVITTPKVEAFARKLRTGRPAVVGYIREGRYLINLLSVFPSQDKALQQALNQASA